MNNGTDTPVLVHRPRFEHHADARIGTGEALPRLSWKIETEDPDFHQDAAEVEITRQIAGGAASTDSYELSGNEQVLVPWPAGPLASREQVSVRVRVRNGTTWSAWSGTGTTEVGLLETADWTAKFVGPDESSSGRPSRAPGRVRREFALRTPVVSARLYLSGHGLVEAEINGKRVGDEELTPGWTSYHHRLRYASFDVTGHLRDGDNAIGIWLGDGWWRGHLGFGGGTTNVYGDRLAALAQLEVHLANGTTVTVDTDQDWEAGPGPIVSAGLYDGEHFDARLHDAAWSEPGYDTDDWGPVLVDAPDAGILVAPTGPPVRCTEELRAVEIIGRGNGRWLLDFGQNHSGRLRVRAKGPRGVEIRLRHAEVLVDGEPALEPLREAAAADVLILGDDELTWEPRFTIHGYRWAEITGWVGVLQADDVVSRVIHSDMERRGWFSSSHAELNRLHENVRWSLRSNFVDIPTDCPQRDERLGWTGDLQVFAPTAAFLYDVTGLLTSWLRDLAVEQAETDWVPPWVPYFPLEPFESLPHDPYAVWSDVAVLTPHDLHRSTGDHKLLRDQYDSAKAYLAHVERAAGEDRICRGTEQLGDWLDPSAPPENPFEATTDKYLVATAYFAHSARRLAAVANIIGETADAERYSTLADEVSTAYAEKYLRDGRVVGNDTQTAYALTTLFGLWPDARSERVGTARLAELVRLAGGRIATGFAGTPAVADALTIGDQIDAAYQLLLCEECPSWLYTVRAGGTTTWERWDSLRPDGTLNASSMTSFNHYALGSVADWMHRTVAGISAAAPGYRRIRFVPRPSGVLTSATAEHETPYGRAAISWQRQGDELAVELRVPVGATAEVVLPGGFEHVVGHGRWAFTTSVSDVLTDEETTGA